MPPDPLELRGQRPLDYRSRLLFQTRPPTSKHFENPGLLYIIHTAILRKVVGKSARDSPVWVILSALFFKEI